MTDSVAPEFWQAVEQFNQRQFYACHDTIEALWFEASDPLRTFYQGVLQIAVALHHLENSNWRGAAILLGEGIERLRRYAPEYGGIHIAQLLHQCIELLQALQQVGADRLTGPSAQPMPQPADAVSGADDFAIPKIERIAPIGTFVQGSGST